MSVKQYNEYGNRTCKYVKKFNNDTSTLFCDYCQLQGHSKDICFCLHNYPEWRKLYGKPKPKPKPRNQQLKVRSQANNVAIEKVNQEVAELRT